MIGKLIEIHELDAFYVDREYLIGTLWDISEMRVWDGSQVTQEITEYMWGVVLFLGPTNQTYTSNEPPHKINLEPYEYITTFHAVKFEILEESGE